MFLKKKTVVMALMMVQTGIIGVQAQCIDLTKIGDAGVVACVNKDIKPTVDVASGLVSSIEWVASGAPETHPRQLLVNKEGEDGLISGLKITQDHLPCIRLAAQPYAADQWAQGAVTVIPYEVTEDNAIAIIDYAAVMQTTPHTDMLNAKIPLLDDYCQPVVELFVVTDEMNVDPATTVLHKQSVSSSMEGWKTAGAYRWKDWTKVAYDLSEYIGKTVYLDLEVRDCAIGQVLVLNTTLPPTILGIENCAAHHHAYMYYSIACAPKEIVVKEASIERGTTTLLAPAGYSYEWYYEDEPNMVLSRKDSVTIANPEVNRTICCRCVSHLPNNLAGKSFTLTKRVHNLTVNKREMSYSSSTCADAQGVKVAMNYETGKPMSYSLKFSDEALREGFADLEDEVLDGKEDIMIAFPVKLDKIRYVRPDDYTAELTVVHANDEVLVDTIRFSVLYPSWVLQQDWNAVIYVLGENYNGGFRFTDVAWYRNGLLDETGNSRGTYYYASNGLNQSDTFVAALTREDDGKTICTCQYETKEQENTITFSDKQGQVVYLDKRGNKLVVKSEKSGRYQVCNVYGICVRSGVFGQEESTIDVDGQQGNLIFFFETEDGEKEAKKLYLK